MINNRLELAISIDDHFIKYLDVFVYALYKHNQTEQININVLSKSLNHKSREKIQFLASIFPNISFDIHFIKDEQLRGLNLDGHRYPVSIFYKLLLPEIIFSDRVLFLDIDTLVLGNISELYHTDFLDHYIVGVNEYEVFLNPQKLDKLGLNDNSKYINVGMVLFNLAAFRANHITDYLFAEAIKMAKDLEFPEQDIINQLLQDKILLVDKRYNHTTDYIDYGYDIDDNTIIYHFNYRKLWQNIIRLPHHFWEKADLYRLYRGEYSAFVSKELKSYDATILIPIDERSENYLLEALDTLSNQSYKNFEAILVDYGISPAQKETIDKYLALDPRFKLLQATGNHLWQALYEGINFASADYVSILYPQDILEETYLENMLEVKDNHQADIVVSNLSSYSEQDGSFYFYPFDFDDVISETVARNETHHIALANLSSKLYKKELLLDFGAFTILEKDVMTYLYCKAEKIVSNRKGGYIQRHTIKTMPQLVEHIDNKKELISVIIPIYNVENYLRECLESIRNQTYPHLEIILVDDCSTDSSVEICKEYCQLDTRFKLYQKEKNGGASDSRNVGLQKASGEYIFFIDSDDWIRLDTIAVLYEQASIHQADIVVGNYLKFYQDSGTFGLYILDKHYKIEVVSNQEALIRQSAWYLNTSVFMLSVCKLFRKSLFENIVYPVGKMFEDEFITHKLFMNSQKNILVNDNFYYYRIRDNSVMTKSFDIKRVYDLVDMIDEKLADYIFYNADLFHVRNRTIKLLYDYKGILEYHQLTGDDIYKIILQKIKFYELTTH